jgi:NAD-dependent deacetylase
MEKSGNGHVWALNRAAALLVSSRHPIAMTGAGVSVESGIPPFRGPGGLWTKHGEPPMDGYQRFLADPQGYWEERLRAPSAIVQALAQAQPNAGHYAMVELEQIGVLHHLITQNIDNLHQASGFSVNDVVELHGNTTYATCLHCEKRYELSWVKEKFLSLDGRAPDCACGGYIKTATISFGQAMPQHEMARAEELSSACDLFIAIGSSLVVWPAAGFPLHAKRNGAKLVIINREPTDFDEIADLVVQHDIGEALGPFVAH